MMKNILKAIMLIFIISLMSSTFVNEVTAYDVGNQDDEIVRTIEKLNELRVVYDLPVLSYSEELNKTAAVHNKYMDFNKSYTSIEESGKLYYRGRYPWDRASYAGYDNTYVFESSVKNINTYTSGIGFLLANPYSRYALLDPLYADLGMNSYDEYNTFLFGGSNRERNYKVVYPYPDQNNVDVNFTNKYIINPYKNISNVPENVGIPITYSIYTSEARVLAFNNLEVSLLNTRTNEYVDIKVINSIEDRNLTNSIMVLPLEAYDYGTTYEISISTNIRLSNAIQFDSSSYMVYVDYAETFTTKQSTDSLPVYSYITRADFVQNLMKISNYIIRDSLEIIFPDVNINSDNYKYIYTAYINKIILGYGDGLYRPEANITREQVYTILIRNYENEKNNGVIKIEDSEKVLEFSDKNLISNYAFDSLYKAKKIGLLVDNQYKFDPGVYITTSEFENIMKRYNLIMKGNN